MCRKPHRFVCCKRTKIPVRPTRLEGGCVAHWLELASAKRMVSICESLTNSAIFDGLLVRLKLSRVVIVEIAVIK